MSEVSKKAIGEGFCSERGFYLRTPALEKQTVGTQILFHKSTCSLRPKLKNMGQEHGRF